MYTNLTILSAIAIVFGTLAICIAKKNKLFAIVGNVLAVVGVLALGIYIATLWVYLGRPPLRTLGETRLWYTFFLTSIGYVTYLRWKYNWFLIYSNSMALFFMVLNWLHPENFDKTLMPALQSYWFPPHVIVYIFGYALLAASVLVAIYGLYKHFNNAFNSQLLKVSDNLVYTGFAFITLGLVFGALWAKEAWGHYWTWDPKETWAFITWLGYLIYIHLRVYKPNNYINPLWMLALAFVVLLIAWFGVNYLPSAQNSVHVYTRD